MNTGTRYRQTARSHTGEKYGITFQSSGSPESANNWFKVRAWLQDTYTL